MLEMINFTSNVCLCVSINDSVNVFTLDLSQVTYVRQLLLYSFSCNSLLLRVTSTVLLLVDHNGLILWRGRRKCEKLRRNVSKSSTNKLQLFFELLVY